MRRSKRSRLSLSVTQVSLAVRANELRISTLTDSGVIRSVLMCPRDVHAVRLIRRRQNLHGEQVSDNALDLRHSALIQYFSAVDVPTDMFEDSFYQIPQPRLAQRS